MRIAVSGASGFVGSHLCEKLELRGDEVFRLSRKASSDDLDSRLIAWDPVGHGLRNPEVLSGFDAVVHLAGRSVASGRWTKKEKSRIRSSRVQATQILAQQISALASPPRCVISASAIGIYGSQATPKNNAMHALSEDTAPNAEGFLASVARDWESACEPLSGKVRLAHPRLGMVLGTTDGALGKVLPLFRLCLGGKLGDGKQVWSWISLQDCIDALIWLLTTETASGPYNLTAPNAVTNEQFTQAVAKQLRRPAILPTPTCLLRLALGEMADALLLSNCRAVPKRLMEQGFQFSHSTLKGFLADELA